MNNGQFIQLTEQLKSIHAELAAVHHQLTDLLADRQKTVVTPPVEKPAAKRPPRKKKETDGS